jgi:SAM-dependent methyltransferase
MAGDSHCPVCREGPYEPFLRLPLLPVHVGALYATREEALGCPRGELDLCVCGRCGFVGNRAFDPARVDYGARYDNALHHSPFFRKFERELATRLVERYGVRDRDVVEIGAGSGHFLALLCELGGNRGTGFDPSHEPAHADPRLGRAARVLRETYGEAHADLPVDLLVCRQVLEHLPDPRGFLAELHRTLARHPDAVLYFEVPNALLALRDLSVWNLVYEHPGNHTATSLAALFARAGFEVLELRETYERNFLGVEARRLERAAPAEPPAEPVTETVRLARALADHVAALCAAWRERLGRLAARGGRAAVWGAGAKGVSFLNLLDLGDAAPCVVDVNPRKQGHFLPGTGQEILAPAALRALRPPLVIVMNPIYEAEIRAELRGLGVEAQVESV